MSGGELIRISRPVEGERARAYREYSRFRETADRDRVRLPLHGPGGSRFRAISLLSAQRAREFQDWHAAAAVAVGNVACIGVELQLKSGGTRAWVADLLPKKRWSWVSATTSPRSKIIIKLLLR
jgi:hypothetical protein